MSPGPPWTVTLRCLSRTSLATAVASLLKVCVFARRASTGDELDVHHLLGRRTGTPSTMWYTVPHRSALLYHPKPVPQFVLLCRSQLINDATLRLYAIDKPDFWDDSQPSPCVVPVVAGSPEFEMVKSHFHVHGFSKRIVRVERVQVGALSHAHAHTMFCMLLRSTLALCGVAHSTSTFCPLASEFGPVGEVLHGAS